MDQIPRELAAAIVNHLSVAKRTRLGLANKQHSSLAWLGNYSCYPRNYDRTLVLIEALIGRASRVPMAGLVALNFTTLRKPLVANEEFLHLMERCVSLEELKLNLVTSAGPIVSSLAKARSPLRKLVIEVQGRHIYQDMDAGDFAVWARTLRKLVLIPSIIPTASPLQIMEGIATHLGSTLEILGLATGPPLLRDLPSAVFDFCAEEWEVLKSMTALKVLYVRSDLLGAEMMSLDSVSESISRQRAYNPPGVGINLIVNSGRFTGTLLYKAAQETDDRLMTQVLAAGADPNVPIPLGANFDLSCAHPSYFLYDNIPVERTLELLASGRVDFFGKFEGRRTSLFTMVLRIYLAGTDWIKLAKACFESSLWPSALKIHKREDLIPTTPSALLQLFSHSLDYHHRIEYLMQHSDIFGPIDPTIQFENGCNLLHSTYSSESITHLMDTFKVDWRAVDNDGHNALQCQARSPNSPALAAIMARIPDQDFIDNCTPEIWGSLGGWDTLASPLEACLFRLATLLPKDRWRDCIGPLTQLHAHTRACHVIADVFKYTGPGHQALWELVVDSFLAPWDPAPFKFRLKYYNLEDLPIPHILVSNFKGEAVLEHLVKSLKKRMTQKEFSDWAEQRDKKGLDWRGYLTKVKSEFRIRQYECFFRW